jgi:hypothetical protein
MYAVRGSSPIPHPLNCGFMKVADEQDSIVPKEDFKFILKYIF